MPAMRRGAGQRGFVRGFIASGCLSAVHATRAPGAPPDVRRMLRHALQGGTALSAGVCAENAFAARNYTGALLAAAAGTAGVLIIERLLRDSAQNSQEKTHGQEA